MKNTIPHKGSVINYDNVTIEHIVPQSLSMGIPGFTRENVHKIGNLTLLTNKENDKVKNKTYKAKKSIYHDSDYDISKYFDDINEWSLQSAEDWEQFLQKMVCKVFVV